MLRPRDPAKYSCQVTAAKGREPLGDCGVVRWSIKPLQNMHDINAATERRRNPSPLNAEGCLLGLIIKK